jgi:hypothetical protein
MVSVKSFLTETTMLLASSTSNSFGLVFDQKLMKCVVLGIGMLLLLDGQNGIFSNMSFFATFKKMSNQKS